VSELARDHRHSACAKRATERSEGLRERIDHTVEATDTVGRKLLVLRGHAGRTTGVTHLEQRMRSQGPCGHGAPRSPPRGFAQSSPRCPSPDGP
jgi:hypothetical protein